MRRDLPWNCRHRPARRHSNYAMEKRSLRADVVYGAYDVQGQRHHAAEVRMKRLARRSHPGTRRRQQAPPVAHADVASAGAYRARGHRGFYDAGCDGHCAYACCLGIDFVALPASGYATHGVPGPGCVRCCRCHCTGARIAARQSRGGKHCNCCLARIYADEPALDLPRKNPRKSALICV